MLLYSLVPVCHVRVERGEELAIEHGETKVYNLQEIPMFGFNMFQHVSTSFLTWVFSMALLMRNDGRGSTGRWGIDVELPSKPTLGRSGTFGVTGNGAAHPTCVG